MVAGYADAGPEAAVNAGYLDHPWVGVGHRRQAGVDPPDSVSGFIGEPQVAVGARRDPAWSAAGGDAGGELGDGAGRGDPFDLARVALASNVALVSGVCIAGAAMIA